MRLGHVALTAEDPKALAAFYERFLGLQRVGEAQTEQGGAMVFLSSEPGGPPELQVMSNLQGRHVAFKVDSLAELRDLYAEAPQRGARVAMRRLLRQVGVGEDQDEPSPKDRIHSPTIARAHPSAVAIAAHLTAAARDRSRHTTIAINSVAPITARAP